VKNKKSNRISLVLFHLLVFLMPLIIKSSHHHVNGFSYFPLSSTEQTIRTAEGPCPICQFEFVNVISTTTEQNQLFEFQKHQYNSELVSPEYKITFTYFSHRAPPIA
jgi:hypothetical protein